MDKLWHTLAGLTGGVGVSDVLVFFAFPAVAIVVTLVIWEVYKLMRPNRRTQYKITKILKRAGAMREWKVLESVALADEKSAGLADHVVVGPFGVLVVTDLYLKGTYYGDAGADVWILSDGGEEKLATFRAQVPSPVNLARDGAGALRRALIANRMGKVEVHTLCAATNNKIEVYYPGGNKVVLSPKELKAAVRADKFGEDKGVDVAKVVAIIKAMEAAAQPPRQEGEEAPPSGKKKGKQPQAEEK